MKIQFEHQKNTDFEIVERKGLGHPDTLADDLAEELSRVYANYTKKRYGVVLHHNFDKVGLMGGMTKVGFGEYNIYRPIRVLINGRASCCFGEEKINLRDMLETAAKKFLENRLYGINTEKDIRIIYEVSTGSSPGAVGEKSAYRNRWFSPHGLEDLSELKKLNCNDTSLGTAFYHHRIIEECVYNIESTLNSQKFRLYHPWIGTDIKIMGCKIGSQIQMTMAIPQMADVVKNIDEYLENKKILHEFVLNKLYEIAPSYDIFLDINTRDRIDNKNTDLYLTATGSSVEMGDEGFVGRGNRIGGLITPFRPYTMEGICGKNPVYHTGKMYSVAAWEISKRIYERFENDCTVLLIGQSGQALNEPWNTLVMGDRNNVSIKDIEMIAKEVLNNFSDITAKLLKGGYTLC